MLTLSNKCMSAIYISSVGTLGRKDENGFPYMRAFSYWYHFSWLLVIENCNSENLVRFFVRDGITRYHFSYVMYEN